MQMTVGFALAAAALMILTPALLVRARWQIHLPRLALLLWFGSFGAGCGCAATALICSTAAGLAVSPASETTVTIVAWLGLAGAGGVIALIAVNADPLAASHRQSVRRLAPIAISREPRRGFTLVRFESAEPVAFAVPGRQAEILVSTGMERLLTVPQLQAVLAHEYAHLRGRHGWVVRAAEINALCLPHALPAGRELRRATMLLVELIADDTAAAQAGAANLANALVRIGNATGDRALEMRAERLTLRSWPSAGVRHVPEAIRI